MIEYTLSHNEKMYRNVQFIPDFDINSIHIQFRDIRGESWICLELKEIDLFIDHLNRARKHLIVLNEECKKDLLALQENTPCRQ